MREPLQRVALVPGATRARHNYSSDKEGKVTAGGLRDMRKKVKAYGESIKYTKQTKIWKVVRGAMQTRPLTVGTGLDVRSARQLGPGGWQGIRSLATV